MFKQSKILFVEIIRKEVKKQTLKKHYDKKKDIKKKQIDCYYYDYIKFNISSVVVFCFWFGWLKK